MRRYLADPDCGDQSSLKSLINFKMLSLIRTERWRSSHPLSFHLHLHLSIPLFLLNMQPWCLWESNSRERETKREPCDFVPSWNGILSKKYNYMIKCYKGMFVIYCSHFWLGRPLLGIPPPKFSIFTFCKAEIVIEIVE